MKTPTASGLIRFALAIMVVLAIVSLAASLPLTGEEDVGLPELQGLPTLGIDPVLLVWIFGFGSVVLFLLAFLLYRPKPGLGSSRGSLRGILPLVFAVSLLIFFSYLVRPAFPLSEEFDPGGYQEPPGGGTGTGAGGATGGDGTGTGGTGSGGDGTPGGTGTGTTPGGGGSGSTGGGIGTGTGGPGGTGTGTGGPGGTGTGTGGPGSGGGEGDPGGTDPGTTPGDGEPGSGEPGTGTGEPGGDSDVPGEDPPQPGEEPTEPESPGAAEDDGTAPPDDPEPVVNRIFPWSDLVVGAFLVFVAFLALVGVHVLRGTFRARRAEALDAKRVIRPSKSLRAELLAAFEGLSTAEGEGETDIRAAILASYDQMVRLFRSLGLNPGHHLTAREVEALAIERLELSPGAAQELRCLFEEARYSVHLLGDLQLREAIESLRRVRSELTA